MGKLGAPDPSKRLLKAPDKRHPRKRVGIWNTLYLFTINGSNTNNNKRDVRRKLSDSTSPFLRHHSERQSNFTVVQKKASNNDYQSLSCNKGERWPLSPKNMLRPLDCRIGYNSVCIGDKSEIIASKCMFSGSANLNQIATVTKILLFNTKLAITWPL